MKVLFLGANAFIDKSGKERYRVDIAYQHQNEKTVGYNALVGFTTKKHFEEMLKIKPLSETEMCVFFPDDTHKCNRIYTKSK